MVGILWEVSLFTGWGTAYSGGRAKLEDPLRGRAKLDDPLGGAKNFGLGQYFFLKPDFFMFLGVLGTFNFWVKGGRTFLDVSWGRTKSNR